jgi:hypothetical protein
MLILSQIQCLGLSQERQRESRACSNQISEVACFSRTPKLQGDILNVMTSLPLHMLSV